MILKEILIKVESQLGMILRFIAQAANISSTVVVILNSKFKTYEMKFMIQLRSKRSECHRHTASLRLPRLYKCIYYL